MSALILKEIRENWRLVLLGGVLSALIMLLYLVMAIVLQDRSMGDDFASALLALTPIVLAVLAGATLVSGERNRGTLPLLLGLPLSRDRIWLGQLLAGMLVASMSCLALEIPAALALPGSTRTFGLAVWLPDITMWAFTGFAVAYLCSVLTERPLHALLTAGLVIVGVLAGAVYLVGTAGGSITGYDIFLDVSLWSLTAGVAALVGSWLALRRGELLWRGRKWLLALSGALLTWAVLFLLVVGLARLPARYQRNSVQRIESPELDPTGTVLSFFTTAGPVAFSRETGRGWGRGHAYRSEHFVLLDAQSGRDLAIFPSPQGAAYISPDGRLAAVIAEETPLTYADWSWWRPGTHLEIWDLSRRTRVYSGRPQASPGLPPLLRFAYLIDAAWAPDSSWLVVRVDVSSDSALLLLEPGGRVRTSWPALPSRVRGWEAPRSASAGYGWAPDARAVYLIDPQANLVRQPVPEGRPQDVWSPGRRAGANAASDVLSVSPDGRWIALVAAGDSPNRAGTAADQGISPLAWRIWAVATDGSRAVLLGQVRSADGPSGVRFAWTGDGRRLFFVVPPRSRGPRAGGAQRLLLSWSPGEAAPRPMPNAASHGWVPTDRFSFLPGRGEVLVSAADGEFLVDAQLHVRTLGSLVRRPEPNTMVLGLDHQGRVLSYTYSPPGISGTDSKTGDTTRLYP